MAARLRARRRNATRHGAPPGGAAWARTSPGTDGLASKAGWVREAKATSCSGALFQAEAGPVVRRHGPVVALAVREVHPRREEGALLASPVHGPVGLLLGV